MGTIRILCCTSYVAGAICVLIHGTGVVVPPYMGRGRICTYPPGIVPTPSVKMVVYTGWFCLHDRNFSNNTSSYLSHSQSLREIKI